MNDSEITSSSHTQTSDLESRLSFSKRLQAVCNKLHAANNLDEIMLDLSKDIAALFNCDRLTIYATSPDKHFIFSKVKTGINTSKDLVLPIDANSIAGYVALTQCTVCLEDVYDEAELQLYSDELRFCQAVDKLTSYHTKQMLAAAILHEDTEELLGVIQLLNNRAGGGFSEIAEEGLEELCKSMAIAFIQRTKTPAPQAEVSKYAYLIIDSIISAPEMELAARWARRKNIDIEEALIEEFQVPIAAIGQALSKNANVPYEPYQHDRKKPDQLLNKIDRAFVEKHQLLPLEETKAGIVILTTDPKHIHAPLDLKEFFSYTKKFFRITTKREFQQTVKQFYG